MPCRANDQCFPVLGANGRELRRGIVETEVNHHIDLLDERQQVVAQINLARQLQLRMVFGTCDERLAHAAFGAGNDDFGGVQN